MRALIVLAIAALLILAAVQAPWPHGLANWIMDDPQTRWCCGPQDCAVAEPGEVVRLFGGWLHVPPGLVLLDREGGHYVSIDSQVWRCVGVGVFRCIFLPVQA